jgi:hypothetical protein
MTVHEKIGRVEAVLVGQMSGTHLTTRVKKLAVLRGYGIRSDMHAGARLADSREKALLEFGLPKDTEIANHRQFSAISTEDVLEITRRMGLPNPIPVGCFGENLIISGLERLSSLPSGTLLLFKKGEEVRTAVLAVWAYNPPCNITGIEVLRAYDMKEAPAQPFREAAKGLRGIVGTVYCSGVIREGDTVVARSPYE